MIAFLYGDFIYFFVGSTYLPLLFSRDNSRSTILALDTISLGSLNTKAVRAPLLESGKGVSIQADVI